MVFDRFAYALIAALCAAPALAQTPAQKETARQLMDTGNQRLSDGDVQGALEAFAAADDIMGVPTTALAMGKAQLELGMLTEAADALRRAARYPKRDAEPEAISAARKEAAELDYQVAERIPALIVVVQGGAEHPEVFVDGEKVPPEGVGLPYRVNPGQHVVEARAEGFEPAQSSLTVAERDKKQVVLQLTRDPNWRPATSGGADAADPGMPWLLPVIGFGVAGLGVTVGAITGGISLAQTSDLKDACGDAPCSEDRRGEHDEALVLANVSNVSFAVAGAGAIVGGVGLYLWLAGDDDGGADEAAIRPYASPFGAGVIGSF